MDEQPSAQTVTVRVEVNVFWKDNPREAVFAGKPVIYRAESNHTPVIYRDVPKHAPGLHLHVTLIEGGFERYGGIAEHPRISPLPGTVIEISGVPADHDDVHAEGVRIVS